MVGKLSWTRVASTIWKSPLRSSIGTLKSTRTSTPLPRASRSRTDNLGMIRLLVRTIRDVSFDQEISVTFRKHVRRLSAKHFHHLNAAIAISPLIVIPANDFNEIIAERERQLAVKDARVRIPNDVCQNQRLVRKFQHAFVAWILRSFSEGL